MKLKHLAASLLLGAAMALGITLPAMAGCFAELSAGGSMANDKLQSGGTIDLSQTGVLAGFGGGCTLIKPSAGTSGFFLEIAGRYNVLRQAGDIGNQSIKSDHLWEAMLRPGYALMHDRVELYGVFGYAGTNLNMPAGIDSKTPQGWMGGGGLRGRIGDTAAWVGVEGDYYAFDRQDLGSGTTVRPGSLDARFVMTYKFNDRPFTQPLK